MSIHQYDEMPWDDASIFTFKLIKTEINHTISSDIKLLRQVLRLSVFRDATNYLKIMLRQLIINQFK